MDKWGELDVAIAGMVEEYRAAISRLREAAGVTIESIKAGKRPALAVSDFGMVANRTTAMTAGKSVFDIATAISNALGNQNVSMDVAMSAGQVYQGAVMNAAALIRTAVTTASLSVGHWRDLSTVRLTKLGRALDDASAFRLTVRQMLVLAVLDAQVRASKADRFKIVHSESVNVEFTRAEWPTVAESIHPNFVGDVAEVA